MKFANVNSMTCTQCDTYLQVRGIVINSRHIYKTGQQWRCDCGKSQIWTNSIRSVNNLIQHHETGSYYYNGFCNDLFCGICKRPVQPLKTGFVYKNRRLDLFGCLECTGENQIVVDLEKFLYEGESDHLLEWYKERIEQFSSRA